MIHINLYVKQKLPLMCIYYTHGMIALKYTTPKVEDQVIFWLDKNHLI